MAISNRYDNGKIYKLVNNADDEIYVGSTCLPLHKRLYDHKIDARHKTMRVYQHLNPIGFDNVQIVLIENFSCKSKDELLKRERHWIDTLKPSLNKALPLRTHQEYYQANRQTLLEKAKEYKKKNSDLVAKRQAKYYEEHKEKIQEHMRNYYEENKDKKREYNEANRDTKREYDRAYREANKEKMKEKYYEQHEANKEKRREYQRQNRETINAYKREWRAKKKAERQAQNSV